MPRDKKESPSDWEDRINAAIEYKRDYCDSNNWKEYREYYRGNYDNWQGDFPLLSYNVIYAIANVLGPSVYPRNPTVLMSPRKPGAAMFAKLAESVANWLIQEMNVKREVRTAVLHTFFCGASMMKIGYEGQYEMPERNEIQLILDEYEESPTGMLGETLSGGLPWCRAVDPDFLLVPFGSKVMDDMEWIDHMVIRPTSRVRRDSMYKNTRGLKGTHVNRVFTNHNKHRLLQKMTTEGDWVELHEIRDLRDKTIKVLVEGYDFYLREEADVLQIDGPPFVPLCFNEDPEYFWGLSDCKIIEPQQLEINESRTQAMLHRRVALARILYSKGALDKAMVNLLMSEKVLPAIEVQGPVDESKIRVLTPHMPQDVMLWTEAIRNDIRELSGIGRMQTGEMSTGRHSATESKIVHDAHNLRMNARRDRVLDMVGDLMRKTMQIIYTMWSTPKAMEVVGIDGSRYWVELTGSQIKNEYDLKLDAGSSDPQTKELRRQEIVQLIQAVGKNPRVNVDYLLRLLLQEFEWLDVMKLLPMSPEMMNSEQAIPADKWVRQQQNLAANPQALSQRAQQGVGSIPMSMLENA